MNLTLQDLEQARYLFQRAKAKGLIKFPELPKPVKTRNMRASTAAKPPPIKKPRKKRARRTTRRSHGTTALIRGIVMAMPAGLIRQDHVETILAERGITIGCRIITSVLTVISRERGPLRKCGNRFYKGKE